MKFCERRWYNRRPPSSSSNELLVRTDKEPGTERYRSEVTPGVDATCEPDNGTTSPATGVGQESLSGSVTDGSYVAIGDRLGIRNEEVTAEPNYEEPSVQELIDRAVAALESSERLARPADAERLRSMSVDDLWNLARHDPDADYVISQRHRQADFERWIKTTVAMAARYLASESKS